MTPASKAAGRAPGFSVLQARWVRMGVITRQVGAIPHPNDSKDVQPRIIFKGIKEV